MWRAAESRQGRWALGEPPLSAGVAAHAWGCRARLPCSCACPAGEQPLTPGQVLDDVNAAKPHSIVNPAATHAAPMHGARAGTNTQHPQSGDTGACALVFQRFGAVRCQCFAAMATGTERSEPRCQLHWVNVVRLYSALRRGLGILRSCHDACKKAPAVPAQWRLYPRRFSRC